MASRQGALVSKLSSSTVSVPVPNVLVVYSAVPSDSPHTRIMQKTFLKILMSSLTPSQVNTNLGVRFMNWSLKKNSQLILMYSQS